jgi:hypothetical protein
MVSQQREEPQSTISCARLSALISPFNSFPFSFSISFYKQLLNAAAVPKPAVCSSTTCDEDNMHRTPQNTR